jgi:hypothetical protein
MTASRRQSGGWLHRVDVRYLLHRRRLVLLLGCGAVEEALEVGHVFAN